MYLTDKYKEGGDSVVWAPRLSKSDARQLNTFRTCGFPKHIIKKRQKTIEHQLQRTKNEIKISI